MKSKVLFLLLCISVSVTAQVKWTIEAGYDLSSHITTNRKFGVPLNGGHIGTSMYWQFTPKLPLGLKTGVKLLAVGYYSTERNTYNNPPIYEPPSTYKEWIADCGILVPLRIYYAHEFNDSWGINLFVGPQISYHFAYSESNEEKHIDEYRSSGSGDFEYWWDEYLGFNCSMGVGLGAHYKHFVISASYDFGLFNRDHFYQYIHNHYPQYILEAKNHIMYSRELEISLGYCF